MRTILPGIRLALMNVRLAMRTRAALFFTFIFPLIFLFAYGGIFANGSPLVVSFLFGPVVVLQIIGSTFFGLGLQLVMLRERGSLRRYRLAPIGPGAMVLASLFSNYLLLLPSVALLFVCARLVFHISLAVNWWDIFWIVTIGDFAFAGFGLVIASLADTMQEAQVYNNVAFFPLLFLSGATIPLAQLPHWLQRVAAFLPATYLVAAFQGVMPQSRPLAAHAAELVALVISGVFGLLLAVQLFRWEKEERVRTGRKLSALACILPLLLMGAWMNARPETFASWSRAFAAVNATGGPPATAAPPHPATWPSAGPGSGGAFVIRDVRIFDGQRLLPADSVAVADGRITAVGRHLPAPAAAKVVEGRGDTLLPGLIDAHVHVVRADLLRQALVFGVTTELDMFMDFHLAQTIKAAQAAGRDLDLADLRSAGTLATAPGGHGTEYGLRIPTISEPRQAQAFVDARLAEGSDYIKIIYDNGATYGMKIPTISAATMAALVRAAHARGKLAVAHIGSYQGALDAISAGVDGLMHLFVDQPPRPDFGRFVAAHHAFVVPTLTVLESIRGIPDGAALAADPRLAPFLPATAVANLKRTFPLRPGAHGDVAYARQAIRLLHAAGVPILAGTDAFNPGTAHGASLHREIELLAASGLTPTEALAAATSLPAREFHLPDRGRIAAKLRADLLLVRGDPTQDVGATRDIVAVWKLGVPVDREVWRAAVAHSRSAGANAPAPAAAGLVSDFEEPGAAPRARFGAGWAISTDSMLGGKSSAAMRVVAGGAEGSKGLLLITGTIAAASAYPWAGAIFYPGAQPFAPANLSSKKAIRFWARGDGQTCRLMLFSQSLGYIPAIQSFAAGANWKQYMFPLSAFQTDGHDLEAIVFTATAPGPFRFQIDNVQFQ